MFCAKLYFEERDQYAAKNAPFLYNWSLSIDIVNYLVVPEKESGQSRVVREMVDGDRTGYPAPE